MPTKMKEQDSPRASQVVDGTIILSVGGRNRWQGLNRKWSKIICSNSQNPYKLISISWKATKWRQVVGVGEQKVDNINNIHPPAGSRLNNFRNIHSLQICGPSRFGNIIVLSAEAAVDGGIGRWWVMAFPERLGSVNTSYSDAWYLVLSAFWRRKRTDSLDGDETLCKWLTRFRAQLLLLMPLFMSNVSAHTKYHGMMRGIRAVGQTDRQASHDKDDVLHGKRGLVRSFVQTKRNLKLFSTN